MINKLCSLQLSKKTRVMIFPNGLSAPFSLQLEKSDLLKCLNKTQLVFSS